MMTMTSMTISANGFSQEQRVTLDVKNVGAMELFKQIQKETNLFFVYNDADLISFNNISVSAKDEAVDVLLNRVFTGLDFLFEGNVIIVKPTQVKDEKKEVKKFTSDKNNKETVPEERVLLDKVNITLLSGVLNKIITLLESLNVFGEVKLYERDGIIYLVFKEKDSSSILRYRVDDEGISKNGKFNKISDRKLRYIIKDSVGVLEGRFAYSVKSISFDYVGVAFREGVMYPSKEEKGTTEIELY